jgi:UDP-N-acetyl-D-glucosamine dehydrogenase
MMRDEIMERIAARRATVGVLGLGYVGLPLLVEMARAGLRALGFEVDSEKAARVNRGDSYIADVEAETLRELASAGGVSATTDFSRLRECDAIIICVPTPLRKTKEPDISFILAAASEISKSLRRGQLIVLESTTYPGTTDEVLLPLFEATGLRLDTDFLLAFSPERVDPGNPSFRTDNIPKVVGGCSADSTEAAAHLYSQIVGRVHKVSSARVAEAAKLLENTFRAVNIGMANEMARLCYALGIDTWEVIGAAATKPFGFMAFYPGPGIGGHCIPLDPHYLSWKARQHGFDSRFISLAEEVNSRMPEHVCQLIADGLNDARKSLRGARILLLGVAYKRDIEDVRESPALAIIERLRGKGAEVRYHDPYVGEVRLGDDGHGVGALGSGQGDEREGHDGDGSSGDEESVLRSVEMTDAELDGADCVVVVTDHTGVDYGRVAARAKLIVDTRNALAKESRATATAHIVRL